MSFDYGYTCPDIDRNISNFKDELEQYLTGVFEELCPVAEGTDVMENWVQENMQHFYSIAEDVFEDVRRINEDMRKAADDQIESLEERVSDLEHEIKVLEGE